MSPDGTIGTNVPLKFVGKLENRERYSHDVISSVIMYAHMAENYLNKNDIEAQLNVLRYNMIEENRKAADPSATMKSSENSLGQYDAMLGSGLYDNQYNLGD
jgi:hypothetical protein